MKKYEFPTLEIFKMKNQDVITSSGTETPKIDDNDGEWELSLPHSS